MVLYPNKLPESERVCSGICTYGGAQPNISSKIICELQFLLPPLMEQKRIVQKIEELYSYFDNIQKALEA